MTSIEISDAEVAVLRALESEDGASLDVEEIGNLVHNLYGNGDDAEAAVPGLKRRGLVASASLDPRRVVLTRVGRWVLAEVAS